MKKSVKFFKKLIQVQALAHIWLNLQNLMTFVGLKTAKIHLLDPDPYSESGSGSRRRFESGSNPDPDPQHCLRQLRGSKVVSIEQPF